MCQKMTICTRKRSSGMDEQKKLEEVLPIKPPFNAEEFWKQIGISELTAGCEGSCSRKKGFDLKAKTPLDRSYGVSRTINHELEGLLL
jgi:hypothetical protein